MNVSSFSRVLMTFAVVSALGIILQVDAAGVGPDQKADPVPADVASSSLPSPDLAAVKAAIALARKGDLAQASDVEESIGDPVSRNELGDHAEWTKLVFVLNIESMHQSPIGSEFSLDSIPGTAGGAQGDAGQHPA